MEENLISFPLMTSIPFHCPPSPKHILRPLSIMTRAIISGRNISDTFGHLIAIDILLFVVCFFTFRCPVLKGQERRALRHGLRFTSAC